MRQPLQQVLQIPPPDRIGFDILHSKIHALLHAVPEPLPSVLVHEEFPVLAMDADLVLYDPFRAGYYGGNLGLVPPRASDPIVERHIRFGDLYVVGQVRVRW